MNQLFNTNNLRDELQHVLGFDFTELDQDGKPQFFTQLVGHFWVCVELGDDKESYRGSVVINEDGDGPPDPHNMIEIFNFDSMTAIGAFSGCARFSAKYFGAIEKRRHYAEKAAMQAEAHMVKFGGISGRQRSLIKHCQDKFGVIFKGKTKEDADIFLDKYAPRLERDA